MKKMWRVNKRVTCNRRTLPGLCGLLHDGGNLLSQNFRGWVLSVQFPVRLRTFACAGDEDAEIGAHAGIDDADVRTHDRDLFDH